MNLVHFDGLNDHEKKTANVITASTSVSVVDAEKDPRLLQGLDYTTWLPFAAKTYQISPNIDDYVLVVTPICPSDIPNRNGIGFPLAELTKFQPPPISRMAYKAWAGCPVHYEHCFTGDTLVQTSKGLKAIEDVEVGDRVLTHKLRYRAVTKLFDNGIKQTYRINALGLTRPILATANHPMWVVDHRQIKGVGVKGLGRREDNVEDIPLRPHWRPVSDIYNLDFLVVPIDIGGDVSVEPEFAFLAGLYAAEGNLMPNNKAENLCGVNITLAFNEKELREQAVACCETLGLSYTEWFNKEGGTSGLRITAPDLAHAMREILGAYSHKKRLKGEIRQWDNDSLLHFLGGYVSGDGSVKNGRLRCRTVSEVLAQDIQKCLGRVGIPASANSDSGWAGMFTSKYHTRKGELRKDKGGKPFRSSSESFCVGASLHEVGALKPYLFGKKFEHPKMRTKDNGPRILVRDNYILLPVSSIEKASKEAVFNIEVEEDHSYIAGGVVVHNCNEDHTKAYGVILDASLHKITGYGQGKLWKVMGLLGIDKRKYPEMARRVMEGEVNTYSMGAYVDTFSCSYCGEEMWTEKDTFGRKHHHHCAHLNPDNDIDWSEVNDWNNVRHIAYRNAHGISPIETSIVESPAWTTALSDHILTRG